MCCTKTCNKPLPKACNTIKGKHSVQNRYKKELYKMHNIISKYILFWTSFRSDSNYSCQSNTMQRETVKRNVPRRPKN